MFRMLFRMFRMFLHILYDRVPGPIPTRARSHPHRGGSGPLKKIIPFCTVHASVQGWVEFAKGQNREKMNFANASRG